MPTKPTKRRAGERGKGAKCYQFYRYISGPDTGDIGVGSLIATHQAVLAKRVKSLRSRFDITIYRLVPVRVVRGRKP